MPIFRGIEEGRADKNYNSPEIDDMLELYRLKSLLADMQHIFFLLFCKFVN
jgi:hypothetical protein